MSHPRAAVSPGDEQAAALVAALAARGETVAAAESLTAGLVCATLARVPGASAVLRGGLVVYATELKAALAGVDPGLLAEHGAVHPEVAARLAEGARDRCGATWGLGLTGVAGPSAQDGVEPGTVHIGLAGPGTRTPRLSGEPPTRGEASDVTVRTLALTGDRDLIRTESVLAAFALLGEHLA
ncbi:CinA family protein [Amycolatopsis sp. DG1A-15b]|uniref:CinA family protein n=1 Tax=Amycolatopsis sp. DG1A-15b TaxID=3052846 RepID=UPI00255BCFB0|nr:CinA family protein [Amycolatopsis sp. DG1A-15b]WIX93069.1 CinA family protein [Amycolatopsis sp. DG1A-15b]